MTTVSSPVRQGLLRYHTTTMTNNNNVTTIRPSSYWFVGIVLTIVLAFQLLIPTVEAGIQSVDMILAPTDQYVVYMVSYIEGPDGLVDLTNLQFEAISESYATQYNDYKKSENPNDNSNDDQPPTLRQLENFNRYLIDSNFFSNTNSDVTSANSTNSTKLDTNSTLDNDASNSTLADDKNGTDTGDKNLTGSGQNVTNLDGGNTTGLDANNTDLLDTNSTKNNGTDTADGGGDGLDTTPDTNSTNTTKGDNATDATTFDDGSNNSTTSKNNNTDATGGDNSTDTTPGDNSTDTTPGDNSTDTTPGDNNGTSDGQSTTPTDGTDTSTSTNTTGSDIKKKTNSTYIDIVVFKLPNNCVLDPVVPGTCDYAELGVGKRIGYDDDSELRWCCSEETALMGLCDKDKLGSESQDYGRLMVDPVKFTGYHTALEVPEAGDLPHDHLADVQGKVGSLASSNYVIMYANCDQFHGRQIKVTGESIVTSEHGFLPGGMYFYMKFFTVLTIIYAGLFVWYGVLMLVFRKQRIAIEQWIILTIVLGLIEVTFRASDYHKWNDTGYRSQVLIWFGIMFGVLKQGLSRCLLVMVSLGWGMVTDRLGFLVLSLIITLGVCYTIVTAFIDALILVAIEQFSQLSYRQESNMYNAVLVLNKIQRVVDVLCLLWVVVALFRTVAYLKRQNQKRKLVRTQLLLKIVFVAIIIGTIFLIISWIDKLQHHTEVVQMQHAWAKDAWTEATYLFVLICIAILWKPNINARAYAFVLEVGDTDYDHDDGQVTNANVGSDLELTETTSNNNGSKSPKRKNGRKGLYERGLNGDDDNDNHHSYNEDDYDDDDDDDDYKNGSGRHLT